MHRVPCWMGGVETQEPHLAVSAARGIAKLCACSSGAGGKANPQQ